MIRNYLLFKCSAYLSVSNILLMHENSVKSSWQSMIWHFLLVLINFGRTTALDLAIYRAITIIINDYCCCCYYWYDFKSLSDHWPAKRAECDRKHWIPAIYIATHAYSHTAVCTRKTNKLWKQQIITVEYMRPGNAYVTVLQWAWLIAQTKTDPQIIWIFNANGALLPTILCLATSHLVHRQRWCK